MKNIAWWSAGATSAVATKLALEMYDNVEVVYIGIRTAHSDNDRFMRDCEKWYGVKIKTVSSEKYNDQFEVVKKKRFINSPYGAACSKALKAEVREKIQAGYTHHIFGFEYDKHEINRAIRFKQQHPKTNPLYPLIERKISGEEAHGILVGAGIDLPEMYKLGYQNNNCVGCVKGGKGYWNKIRLDFPEVFDKMAKLEREIGATCIKELDENEESRRVYLDELDPKAGNLKPIVPSCGLFCQSEFEWLMDNKVAKVMNGELDIKDV